MTNHLLTKYANVYIGLGSNLDNPPQHIQDALNALSVLNHCRHVKSAPWYSSKAIGPGEQPDYVNTVVSLQTRLSPIDLLHQLQAIENQHGRERNIRWGARTLDLDLLLCDNVHINSEALTVPHPEMQNRNFVLFPLYDLAPSLTLPNGSELADLVKHCDASDLQPIINDYAEAQSAQ